MSEPQLGQKLVQIYSGTPIGSLVIMALSLFFTIFNFNLSIKVSILDAINPLKLGFFTLYHNSWWHSLIAFLVFPLGSVRFEREKGTLATIYSFFLFNFILGQLFIGTSYLLKVLSLFTWNMDAISISGLDISFMAFITIEAMNLESDLNSIPPMDQQVPKFMYPVGFMFLLELVLWDFLCTRHLVGIVLGYLYSQKIFHGITPSAFTFGNIESMTVLQPIVKSNIYVPHPGAITLDGNTTSVKRESFLDQVRSFVGNQNSQYVAIDEENAGNVLLENKDPLWDDMDEYGHSENFELNFERNEK